MCLERADGWVTGDVIHLDRYDFRTPAGNKFPRIANTGLTSTSLQVYVPNSGFAGPSKSSGDSVTLGPDGWVFQVRIW